MTSHHRPDPLDTHMNFRMSSADKHFIEMAAQLKGLKPNTYVRKTLLEAAEKDLVMLNNQSNLLLDDAEWQSFLSIMEAPIIINPKLKKAFKEIKKLPKL